jgi:hypothetical protein
MLEFFDLHYAIRGDGEAAFPEFLTRLEKGAELNGLGGFVRRENGAIAEDNEPLRVPDLDALPIANPARYLDLRPYRRFDSPLQVQTKRGCALSCTYCTYNRIEGARYRLRDPVRIADEMERLVRETGIDYVEFTDSTFNIPLDHAKAVLRAVIAKGLGLRLRTMGLNPGAVDEELADLIREAGFRDVDLGVESACDRTLGSLGKNYTKEAVVRAGRLLRERSIPVTWYLLVGAPLETEETLGETFSAIDGVASPWDLVNVGVGVRVYKGSPLADECVPGSRDGFLRPAHVEPDSLSLDAVKLLTKRAALGRCNYFMYDEDENTPELVLMAVAWLFKRLAPRQPIWRSFIALRTLQRWLGINLLRRVMFERRERKEPAQPGIEENGLGDGGPCSRVKPPG